METKPLQIVQLEAKNVMNLKAIRITPDKKMIVLTGKNEAGKSNILNVIQSMLEGLKLKMPIRQGEERADASIDLGDIKIRKRWTLKGEALEVFQEMEDGKRKKFSSPQTFLNELTGKMVDPMKLFLMMRDDPKKFRNTLANLVGLDLSDLNTEEQGIRDERKLVNDKIRDAVAQLKELTPPDPDTPEEEVTYKDKVDACNSLREKQRQYFHAKEQDSIQESKIQQTEQALDEARKNVSFLEGQLEELKGQGKPHLPEQVTDEQITAAEAEIEKLEDTNVKIREAKRYRTKVKDSQRHQKDSDALTQKLERINQDKQTRIVNCKFPVDGLSLTEDTVLYEGKPVEVASSGRQIRIFTKMAMALSPKVKVILVRDGSFLDSQGFDEVCKIAEEAGYQIWMEKVDESGQVGVFIENGEIKNVDGKPQPQEEENAQHPEDVAGSV